MTMNWARQTTSRSRRWDFLAFNEAATALFGEFPDWERSTRIVAARFRADSARHIGDPQFEQLIGTLRKASPEFCRAWKKHEVARSGEGRKEILHPRAGRMVFEHAIFNPQEAPEQRLVLYSPLPDEDTPATLARLLG
jgi:hypothetical protein